MTPTSSRGPALLLCGLIAGMLLLDLHKVSIAIPSIEHALHPGPIGIQLISAAYVVCFAVTLVPAGRIGDGGRRLQLTFAGLYLYLFASVVCAAASQAWMLISGRALLGVAAGLLMPQMMGFVQQMYAPHERGRAFGVYGMCVSVATALGPSLGGLLMTGPTLGWRGVFIMNVPVGVVMLVAAHRLLPAVGRAQRVERGRLDMDLVGLAAGSAAIVLLLAPLIFTTGRPADDPARWLLLAPAALLAAAFVLRSRRRVLAGRAPVIDIALLRIASFRNGVLVSLTWFASGPGIALGLTIYLQEALGFSPFLAGVVMLPSSVTSAYGAWIGGRLVMSWGRALTGTGMLLVLTATGATLAALHSGAGTAVLVVVIPLLQLVSGLGSGLVVSPNHSMTLMDVPSGKGSAASAIGQLGQRLSNSFGVAAASVAYYSTIYGPGLTLQDAPAALHLRALDRTIAVALCFLLMALGVVAAERRRGARAGGRLRDSSRSVPA